ncbi:MAG: carbamoyltransferase HypF [Abditibacteriota bacterium]|nr:carbamoyltransferase HypF [Abditibacteriota bacterium]
MLRKRIVLSGTVQGVGFRPFVWRLASEMGVTGFVCNRGSELLCEAQASGEVLDLFVQRLCSEAPVNSRIEKAAFFELPPREEEGFVILKSRTGETGSAVNLSPDLAMCEACRRELEDPLCRRYMHPFISCTACGPRFSIARRVPYDRENTSMDRFPMCDECREEYTRPMDRRYHAQPVACHRCGPRVFLRGTELTGAEAVKRTRELLLQGGIAAVKGIGGYHLFCNAMDSESVERLRLLKRRESKPLAIMARRETCRSLADISPDEEALLASTAAPVCLLKKKPQALLPKSISPDNTYLGVMLPYTPLHYLLVEEGDVFVATSGNPASRPVCYRDPEAESELAGLADCVLYHDREITMPADDSVVRVTAAGRQTLRRARGYVPEAVTYYVKGKTPADILATGSDLKNTVCLKAGSRYVLSQYTGDLKYSAVFDRFRETVDSFKRLFGRDPNTVCCDMHPDYLSSRYARSLGRKTVPVQHHRAHVAAVAAEHGLQEPVIGVAFDGTGYGDDGTIWGGEFFTGEPGSLERRMHLESVPLQGGDAAIYQPVRSFVSYMYRCGADLRGHGIIMEALRNNINVCPCSGAGRLFDAAAWACGLRRDPSYEARNSILLESMSSYTDRYWPVEINGEEILSARLVERIGREIAGGMSPAEAASVFHRSVAQIIVEACLALRRDTGIKTVCLGGGVFQNRLLLDTCFTLLQKGGFGVYTGNRIPVNDEGISLGQALIGQMMENS